MSTCAVVRSLIESKTTEVQTSNVGFTSEVSNYLVVHTGPDAVMSHLSVMCAGVIVRTLCHLPVVFVDV